MVGVDNPEEKVLVQEGTVFVLTAAMRKSTREEFHVMRRPAPNADLK